jgi:LmbE family N-acetylglucosaminyl deacetylase
MIHLNLERISRPLRILCLAAHSDDIEIGCGGTILSLSERYPNCEFHWSVFTASGARETEARRAASLFGSSHVKTILLKSFHDGFLPYIGDQVKTVFETDLKGLSPDLIFTHNGADAHQDHRLISQLTWNTFRDHFILEYEIPKYDGDMGRPNVFMQLDKEICERKVHHLMESFPSQRAKPWFQPETFFSLMRLRGMECNSPSGYGEAFYCRKVLL